LIVQRGLSAHSTLSAKLAPHPIPLPAKSGEREQCESATPSAAHSEAFFNGSLVPATTPEIWFDASGTCFVLP